MVTMGERVAAVETEVKNLKDISNTHFSDIKNKINGVEKKLDVFLLKLDEKADKSEIEKINMRLWKTVGSVVLILITILGFLMKSIFF